jgi:hypothetical protein
VSPLEGEKLIEYQDQAFLRALGLERLASRLAEFWPANGPCWDALAIVQVGHDPARSGALLVEAKSHLSELRGEGCCAESDDSRRMIEDALRRTKHWLGAEGDGDWTGKLYQYANRLAHLYFLLQAGVPAWLVNVYFLGDRHFPSDYLATVEECRAAIAQVKADLGLTATFIPHAADVYLQARNRSELIGPLA